MNIYNIPILGFMFKNKYFIDTLRVITVILFFYALYVGIFYPDSKGLFTTALFWGFFWPFFMILSLATFGKIFCGICPHGFIGKYLTRFGLKKEMPKSLKNPFVGLSIILVTYWFVLYTFSGFYKSPLTASIFFLVLTLIAFIIFFLFKDMGYCKSICPIGSITTAFSRVSFTWLSTKAEDCKSCKTFHCAKACEYKISPFNFNKNNSMSDCTLCMDCADICESVKFEFKKPSFSLMNHIKKTRTIDVWVYILLFASASLSMQFHHAIGRSGVNEFMPWTITAKYLKEVLDLSFTVNYEGLLAFIYALAITLFLSLGSFWLVAKILKLEYQKIFITLGYALAPLMIVSGLSHILQFFFYHYYSDIVNGFITGFNLNYEFVKPLASMKEKLVKVFSILSFVAVFWSLFLMNKRLNLLTNNRKDKIKIFPIASILILFYLAVTIFVYYAFATYGVAHHH